jgi:hypothetical protein
VQHTDRQRLPPVAMSVRPTRYRAAGAMATSTPTSTSASRTLDVR